MGISTSFAQKKDSIPAIKDSSILPEKLDTITVDPKDPLTFPLQDRRGDWFTWRNKNPFDIKDTSIINQNIEYDPKTKKYFIYERVGNHIYREPTYLSFEEFYALQNHLNEDQYFQDRADALMQLNKKLSRPHHNVYTSLFDRIFGAGDSAANGNKNGLENKFNKFTNKDSIAGNLTKQLQQALKVDIQPQGSIDIMMGYQGQKTLNPTLPESARSSGGFDFNMNTNFNVNANIGNKLKIPLSYNTLANFDYLNQLKLEYKGKDDEIIKSINAGNMSWQSRGSLQPSYQNLFGLKAQLQFGKLFITAAIAQQKSQTQTQSLKGGATTTNFNLKLDDYDENRNFLLGQYFKNNFNTAMAQLPVVNSQAQIQRVEVWITNRTGATTNARFVAGFMDLGESNPYNPNNAGGNPGNGLPDNGSNGLYSKLVSGGLQSPTRSPSTVGTQLNNLNLNPVTDYEITFARQLSSNEFYFNPQTGFISLNTSLQPSDVLAVAYQYTANGRVYQVGEFASDIGLDTGRKATTADTTSTQGGVQQVLFLKLLKATAARTNLPIWDLMMKNVYSLGVTGLSQKDFKLNIYYNDPSGGLKMYLPESSPAVSGQPLLKVLNLDRLNSRGDPQPDGVFDYVEGFTVLSQQGKIIFPVLQPFGKDLQRLAFNGTSADIQKKYLFSPLYDSIKAIALTNNTLDRYQMQGQATATGTSEIYLGAFNIPQGSVKVTAGGQQLVEGADYVVDYNLGSVKIINQSILNSGVPVSVSFENNANIGVQQKGFFGLRAEYIFNKKLSAGFSITKLKERPYYTKVDYGQDPINNTMYGADLSYKSEMPGLTRLLGRLPFYTAKANSYITSSIEGAYLKPGHPAQIGSGSSGLIYVDDFEGSTSNLDLRFPLTAWALASTPQRFPEFNLTNDLNNGKSRAKIAWYNIEPNLQDKNSPTNPLKSNLKALSDPRTRLVYTSELFPQTSTNITNTQTTTFDIAYYPEELGPYNYEADPNKIDKNGHFTDPKSKWGGLMRALDQTDFITNNFQYIEFWVQDPFIKNPTSSGGKLYINLGDVSEDILKDGKRSYENGLNTPSLPAAVDSSSVWGTTPLNPIQITQAFSNNPSDRVYQDVGYDGLDDSAERYKRRDYLQQAQTTFSPEFYNKVYKDPSHDDYVWYRDTSFGANSDLLGRYKNYNGPDGNSPVVSGSSTFAPASTLYPDDEDINHDNTLNQTEQYFEYEIPLKTNMSVGSDNPYIAQVTSVPVTYADGTSKSENWYLFRVPIQNYTSNVGNIPDFQSVRYLRMYMTGFEDSTVLRFATLNLVRNQWRNYTYALDTTGVATPLDSLSSYNTTTFNTRAVSIQEDYAKKPVNYVIPPGIERVQQLSNNGVNILQNEQSMSMQVYNLRDGEARADFKTTNLDLRSYGKLSMFAHAENIPDQLQTINDNDLNLVVRIGQDFTNNFYEIKVPLKVTPPNGNVAYTDPYKVWPAANNLDFNLQDLINFKLKRDKVPGYSVTKIYRDSIKGDPKTYSIMGNPNFAQVQGILIGVENRSGKTVSAEVWVDELRLSGINEKPAYAVVAKADIQLSDLGKISVSAGHYSQGWGTIEQHTNERSKDNLTQLSASISLDAAKLLPKKFNVALPVYASINKNIVTPQYDPYDQDVLYSYKLSNANSKAQRDSIKRASLDQTTITTINLTNMHFLPKGKPHLLSASNFDASISYTHTSETSPTVLYNDIKKYKVNVGYTYNNSTKYKEPFKNLIKNSSPWLNLIKDFNFNLKPSLISVRADVNRQFGQFTPRIVNTDEVGSKVERVDTTYDKYFTFDRFYNLRWDLTRSINLDFSATNNAYVDEPDGGLSSKGQKDSMWTNFFKGGRNTKYTQKTTTSYNVPFNKIPALDWLTARYAYGTSYDWIAASLLATGLGNTIENSQSNTFTGEIDLTKIYNRIHWLKAANAFSANTNLPTPNRNGKNNKTPGLSNNPTNALGIEVKTREEIITDKNGFLLTGAKKREALSKWRKQKRDIRIAERLKQMNSPLELNDFERITGRFIASVKRISINYSENYTSRIPGYMDSTQFLGQDWKTNEPGLSYIFGKQPTPSWLDDKAALGLISRDSSFNFLYRQNFAQKLSIAVQLEPIKDLKIDLNIDKTFSKEYSELYKDTLNPGGSSPQHLNPYASGGFNISFISASTLFRKTSPNIVSYTFLNFEAYRPIISNRVAQNNPYSRSGVVSPPNYSYGYGRYSQDVLIPAFIAAYTGKDPHKIPLINENYSSIKTNPFAGIKPMPNWRMTYSGLTKLHPFSDYFTQITITHGYTGNLSMNSFTSALNFQDTSRLSAPSFYDTVSHNYVPFYIFPNITIAENFGPLLGVDATTKSNINVRVEYKKSRTLSLSLIDYQLSETNSTEFVLGAGYKVKGVKLPFEIPFLTGNGKKKLQNDLNYRLDVSVRNDQTTNSQLDQYNTYGTGGQKVVTIQPSIDYILNKRIDAKLFFDQRRTTPYISTSAPTITTRFGLQLKIGLGP